jgi:hypothetical protein
VTCVEGNWKEQGKYFWNGTDFSRREGGNDDVLSAVFDGNAIHMIFSPARAEWLKGRAFASYKLAKDGDAYRYTNSQVQWRKRVDWSHDVTARTFTSSPGSDAGDVLDLQEGVPTSFEVFGEVPSPVVCIIANYCRLERLLGEWTDRRNRQFTRCKKLIFKSKGKPWLCTNCSAGDGATECVCCGAGEASFSGMLCKMCTPKQFYCARCGDAVGTHRVEGKVCSACGAGGRDCVKMLRADTHRMI